MMRMRTRSLRAWAVALLAASTAYAQAATVQIGVNVPADGTTDLNTQRASLMQSRNLKAARVAFIDSWGDTAQRLDLATKLAANGTVVQGTIFPTFTWDHSCSANLAAVESTAYNDTATVVNKIKNVVHDFELINENQGRSEISAEVNATGGYAGPCVASLNAALRGMSRAISDIRASSGLPLRTVMGTIGNDWRYLAFMRDHGVAWDVTGFHNYPAESNASLLTDTWYGAGGPLTQLAAFGKPITINEFNCWEIYSSSYEDQAGMPMTEECLRSVAKHMKEILAFTGGTIESVDMYELLNDPTLAGSEGHFGLLYNMTTPKVELYLVTAFAGGPLTAAEQYEVTSRGLLTDAEIAAFKQAATSTTTTAGTSTSTSTGTSTGTTTTTSTTTAPATTTADTTAPSVTITSPANGSTAPRGSTITVTANATDNVGVKQVNFYLNSNLVCSSNAAPYSCNMTLPNGKKSVSTVQAQATDAAGNVGKASITVSNR